MLFKYLRVNGCNLRLNLEGLNLSLKLIDFNIINRIYKLERLFLY